LVAAYGALTAWPFGPWGAYRMPWLAVAGADIGMLAAGQWLLAAGDLIPLAVLTPGLVAAVTAHELGLDRALRVAAIATAVVALVQGFGPGPDPTWRTVAAVFGTGSVAGWAAFVGIVGRRAQEALARERRNRW